MMSFIQKNCLTRYLTSRHNWDCLHPWDCLLPFTCPDVFHPAVHWVQAVVEWGAELPDGNQVSTSDLQDTPSVVSAYKEEKSSPSSLSCDGACCVITQIVAVVRCGAIFLMMKCLLKAKSVSCWSSIAKNAHNYWRCYVFWSIFYFVHPINHVWRTTFCCNFNLNIFTIFVILAAWHINPWFRGRPSTEFNVWRLMVTVNKWELIIDCDKVLKKSQYRISTSFEIHYNLTIASVRGSVCRSTRHGVVYQFLAGYSTIHRCIALAWSIKCWITANCIIHVRIRISCCAPSA